MQTEEHKQRNQLLRNTTPPITPIKSQGCIRPSDYYDTSSWAAKDTNVMPGQHTKTNQQEEYGISVLCKTS